MPPEPDAPFPIYVAVIKSEDTGNYAVRIQIPIADDPEGKLYTLDLTGESALRVGDSIRFAAHSLLSSQNPNIRYQA